MTVYSLVGSSTGEKSAVAFVTRLLVMSLYFSIVALLAFLAAKGYERLLQLSLRHAEELEQARAGLTTEVAERTRELQQALDDVRERNKTIHQLSVPILPVAEGVLALPLLGLFDHERARLLTEQLLAAIQRTRVHTVLIDITGVPTVDADTAAALVQSAQAVRLLGAEVVLVGIRAEVAGTIVSHGIDVDQLTTLRDLHSGLRYALRLEHTDVASR
jgi:rsbT co-antagonist protein RsbR